MSSYIVVLNKDEDNILTYTYTLIYIIYTYNNKYIYRVHVLILAYYNTR